VPVRNALIINFRVIRGQGRGTAWRLSRLDDRYTVDPGERRLCSLRYYNTSAKISTRRAQSVSHRSRWAQQLEHIKSHHALDSRSRSRSRNARECPFEPRFSLPVSTSSQRRNLLEERIHARRVPFDDRNFADKSGRRKHRIARLSDGESPMRCRPVEPPCRAMRRKSSSTTAAIHA